MAESRRPDHHRHDTTPLTPIGEVLAHVLAGSQPLATVAMPLRDALGCVLAEPLLAASDLPPFDCSAMDGFAVRSVDVATTPVTLSVIGATMAGEPPGPFVGEGEAVRVMTGAPIPPGADAVVMIELTTAAPDGGVVIEAASGPGNAAARPGHDIRPAGDDVRRGDVVFQPGSVLTPAHLGIAASLGRTRIVVHPRPVVGVLSTGDELRSGSGPLEAGAIRDSNKIGLSAALEQSGFRVVDLGVARDEEDAVVEAISSAVPGCDAVITTGGVSVGDRDVVKSALHRLAPNGARSFAVAVRPAKPFAFAELPGGGVVFGLPGNPVSALVSFELFARPALRRMAGHSLLYRPSALAVADEPFERGRDGKVHLLRVRVSAGGAGSLGESGGRLHVASAGNQGSHQLSALAGANALAVLANGDGVPAGDEVSVLLLDTDVLATSPPPELAAAAGESGGTRAVERSKQAARA